MWVKGEDRGDCVYMLTVWRDDAALWWRARTQVAGETFRRDMYINHKGLFMHDLDQISVIGVILSWR